MAINRTTTSVRRGIEVPDAFTPQQQMQPQMQLEDMLALFGPEGPPASFDPTTFTPSADYTPKTATWTPPKEEHPYLPGEDYFAFTRRMDKVLGRGPMDVPKPGDPDFTPTMIDMWAKLPGKDRFRGKAMTTSGIKLDAPATGRRRGG